MAKKQAKRRKLTPQRAKFVQEIIRGASLAEAARRAGYKSKRPNQAGYQTLERIQKSAPELLASHGLTDDALIDKYLLPLMNANKRTKADWRARDNGLDKAFKIRGMYLKDTENTGAKFSVVIINAAHRPDWSAMKRANETEGEPTP